MGCSYVEGTCGQEEEEKKKRSGIGDFHNYASQAFATIQLTVFFLPCQVGLLWLVLMQHPPPNPAPSPAFLNTPALSHFTISKWLKKKKNLHFLSHAADGRSQELGGNEAF